MGSLPAATDEELLPRDRAELRESVSGIGTSFSSTCGDEVDGMRWITGEEWIGERLMLGREELERDECRLWPDTLRKGLGSVTGSLLTAGK